MFVVAVVVVVVATSLSSKVSSPPHLMFSAFITCVLTPDVFARKTFISDCQTLIKFETLLSDFTVVVVKAVVNVVVVFVVFLVVVVVAVDNVVVVVAIVVVTAVVIVYVVVVVKLNRLYKIIHCRLINNFRCKCV